MVIFQLDMERLNTGLATLNDNRRSLLRELIFDNADYPCACDLGKYIAVQFYNKRIVDWDVWVYASKNYYKNKEDVISKIATRRQPIEINSSRKMET